MSSNPIGITDIKSLVSNAVSENEVSDAAGQIMISSLNDTNILGCTGVDVDDLTVDNVTLVSIALDASYSMYEHEQTVREAYDELVIKAMKESKQANSMLVSTRVFDETDRILYGFKKVEDVGKVGSQYTAQGGATLLHDTAIAAMTGIRAYAKNLNDSGVQTKCIVVVMSDGGNNTGTLSPDPVKKLAEDCIKSEMFYLVYVGFKQHSSDNLEAIGKSMGFPNVLTAAKSPSEMRKAMGLVSQSIIRASQTQVGPSNSFF